MERQRYAVPTFRGMEWDQFDTPAAVYLLWCDEAGRIRAVARLIPTTFPYIIQELWPELIADGEMPSRDDVWEVSRLGVDRDLEPGKRRLVLGEMLCGCGEYALRHGVQTYLFVTHPRIIKAVLSKSGCVTESIGSSRTLGRLPIAVARTSVTPDALARLRRCFGVRHRVLRIARESQARVA